MGNTDSTEVNRGVPVLQSPQRHGHRRRGNTNSTEVPPSSTDPAPKSIGDMIQNLQEEITCSICLGPFNDPVSIDCGHNFCQNCLSNHWKDVLNSDYRCPECRHLCSRFRMNPDTRLKNLVEKIGQLEEDNKELKIATASVVSGQAVQLMGLDENGNLFLNEATLKSCLEQKQVKDVPICLIAIIGEQRRGKSFLLNVLLRRLQNLNAQGGSWLGQEDEPLAGFEWRPGTNSTTKGVWIWNQPFWVSSEDGTVALFLVDTEGSMDIQRSKEVSVKLSAFSMLFSSYQILNVPHMLKDTDLEYLDMFVYVAQTVGSACKLKPVQHLDVLVRDWLFPPTYGFEGGQTHLQDVIQKLEKQPNRYSQVLLTLKSKNCHCFLMPFPGKKLVMGNENTIAGMDEDFRNCLRDYGNYIARSAGKHIKRNKDGTPLTGAELCVRIKDFSDRMKQYQFGFSSAKQMAITLHNVGIQETFLKKFKEFIREQDQQTRPLFASLKVKPSLMHQRCLQKKQELLQRCRASLHGDEPDQKDSLLYLESHLQSEAECFKDVYARHFKNQVLQVSAVVGAGALGLAGGAIGAGVAAALLATEAIVAGTAATFAVGTVAGASSLALVGGGVGAGVGARIGGAREAKNDSDPDEDDDSLSDEKKLIG